MQGNGITMGACCTFRFKIWFLFSPKCQYFALKGANNTTKTFHSRRGAMVKIPVHVHRFLGYGYVPNLRTVRCGPGMASFPL